jgi:lysophospholipase L1-like esterase
VVASLGDSITAGTPLWDPDPAVRDQLPQLDRRSEYGYWAERERPGTEYRNCGVPGERTDEIALRLGDCARGADALIVQGGVNDLSQGVEPAAVARNLRAMVRRGRELGLDAAIVEVLPWNGGYPDYADEVRELNRRIAAIAHEEGAELIPWYRVLEDPAKPGRMRLDLTVDLAHPTVKGYRLLGEAVDFP